MFFGFKFLDEKKYKTFCLNFWENAKTQKNSLRFKAYLSLNKIFT